MNKFYFHDHNIKSGLFERKPLRDFLLHLFNKEDLIVGRVDFIFGTDDYILKINKRFLNHNYYTDTVTFLNSGINQPILGESYLSIERIRENAKNLNLPYKQELIRVIIHSCLHLCGYQDNTNDTKLELFRIQENYVQQWYVSRET